MAKQRKAKEHNPDSPFLFFDEPGSEYTGRFSHWQETKFGMAIVFADGKLLGMKTVLEQLFESVATKLKKGDKITVHYLGKSKRTKLYAVVLNGKKLEQKNFNKPADTKSVSKWFNRPKDTDKDSE